GTTGTAPPCLSPKGGSAQSAADPFRDGARRRVLLIDGRMDRCGNCRYFADNGVHLFNCLWGIVGGRLDRADLFGDSNDFVGSRQHVLVIDIDDRTHRTSAVKSVEPFLESVRIGLDPLLE